MIKFGHTNVLPMVIEKITPALYIRLNKKICNPKLILTVHRLAEEKLETPQQICYDLLKEAILREYNKNENLKYK